MILTESDSTIFRGTPLKHLTLSYSNITGTNNTGQLVFYHRGGGYSKRFKLIDFRKKFFNTVGLIKRIEYDAFRKNNLSLIAYKNGVVCYNLLIKNLNIGDIICDYNFSLTFGSTYFLKQIPTGSFICLVESQINKGLQLVRSPGSKAQVLGRTLNATTLKLPSGQVKKFSNYCRAVYGVTAISLKKKLYTLKAGTNRNNNLRPIVRGVAMNPIDHPHGGGQGKTSGGRRMSVSPWSKYTKGLKPKKKKLSTAQTDFKNISFLFKPKFL